MLTEMFGESIKVRCLFVTLAYPPTQSSGAIQMKHLACEFASQGHQVLVVHPDHTIRNDFEKRGKWNLQELSVNVGALRDVGYIKRVFLEFVAPFKMWKALLKEKQLLKEKYDIIVWYVPSIFLTPLVARLKKRLGCPVYLIQRDIFPDWMLDLGLLPRGIRYMILEIFARYQYLYSDVVGVQSANNVPILKRKIYKKKVRVEVLHNWLTPVSSMLKNTKKVDAIVKKLGSKRWVFVYAGNMGVAQDIKKLVNLALSFPEPNEYHFLFIGRGSEQRGVEKIVEDLNAKNITIMPEITHEELSKVLEKCDIGLVSLDRRHKTHNVPGKILSYLNAGLPVVVLSNAGNDVIEMINDNNVGYATSSDDMQALNFELHKLLKKLQEDSDMPQRCKNLARSVFSTERAVSQIVKSAIGNKNFE